MKRFIYFILILLIFPSLAFAAGIRAHVDRTRISSDESVHLTVTISDGEGSVDVSPIKDFRVLSRGSGTSVRIVNGRMSKEANYNYTLIPLKTGILKIPALPVQSDGNRYVTEEIAINVSGNPTPQDDERDVFITAGVSTQKPYIGQQVVYTVKVFHAVQFSEANFQQPDFNGFTAEKVEKDQTYKTLLNSREYNVIELNYVLIPLKTGMLKIEPAVLNCSLVRLDKRRRGGMDSFFDDPFFGRTRLVPSTVSTEMLEVHVEPLPPYNADAPFTGLVGRFDVKTVLENNEMIVGDSTTLSVVLSGTGNIMDAEAPNIKIPEAFKVYKDNPEEEIVLGPSGFSGKKVFRMALVPVKEGKLYIEPFQFSYFDVSKKRYDVIETNPFSINVKPAPEKETYEKFSLKEQDSLPKFQKNKVEFTGRDILPLKEDLTALKSRSVLTLFWFVVYLVVPVFGFLLVMLFFLSGQKETDVKNIMIKRANQALKKAKQSDISVEDFLSCLYSALVSAVLSRTGIKGESLTNAEVKSILKGDGFSAQEANEAAELLSRIETARYSGRGMPFEDKSLLLDEIKVMLRRIL